MSIKKEESGHDRFRSEPNRSTHSPACNLFAIIDPTFVDGVHQLREPIFHHGKRFDALDRETHPDVAAIEDGFDPENIAITAADNSYLP